MTIVVIAHRLSTIKRCDRIFAICDRKIKEAGTHDELMHKKGFYYSLWKEQLHCMSGNTTKVKNIKKYLLADLFNASSTMNGYYQAEVNHDMPGLVR